MLCFTFENIIFFLFYLILLILIYCHIFHDLPFLKDPYTNIETYCKQAKRMLKTIGREIQTRVDCAQNYQEGKYTT